MALFLDLDAEQSQLSGSLKMSVHVPRVGQWFLVMEEAVQTLSASYFVLLFYLGLPEGQMQGICIYFA